ncbi:sensor histidine kinase [Cohnella nanjingensis]|uniref:Sensor histidine kinase n=1 Tax=Cohnella nanjingensis TaxID=1387779 RepID=A0A7X0RNN5_9BACL|nr:sensor histidine kinase [Cohnella nanjingensis]MBB6670701.1 sensor histidine kinase [Cohnella nanjingensis]
MTRPSLNNVRLRNKLLLLYFLSVFFPIVVTNALFYSVTAHNVRSQKERDMHLALDRVQAAFRSRIEDAVGISSVFYMDGSMNDALDTDYAATVDYLEVYEDYLRPNLRKYAPVYRSIQELTLYTDNPTVLGAGGVDRITDPVRREEWYERAMAAPSGVPALVHSRTPAGSAFSIVRRLNVFDGPASYVKILKIDLSPDMVRQTLDNRGMPSELYLVSPSGVVEYATDSTAVGRHGYDSAILPKGALAVEKRYDNVGCLSGWTVAGLVPEAEMLSEVRKSRVFVVYLACANLLLPTFVIAWISKSLHDRLLRIVKQIKKVKNRNFEPIPLAECADEIGQLATEFNRMTRQIKTLIDDVYLADIQKKDLELQRRRAQLHALQSQINPHFLFNTLETLRMRSLIKGEEETARIIGRLSKIFRRSLSWGSDWIPVRQELELIESFLDIQKYRFGDKLAYRIQVGEGAESYRIPKMILLPFVENASIHGIESIEAQGLIELELAASGGELTFLLRDNGKGMDARKLGELLSDKRPEEGAEERVGIRNVAARLHLYYGKEASLQIESEPGIGTTVLLRLPHPHPINFPQ